MLKPNWTWRGSRYKNIYFRCTHPICNINRSIGNISHFYASRPILLWKRKRKNVQDVSNVGYDFILLNWKDSWVIYAILAFRHYINMAWKSSNIAIWSISRFSVYRQTPMIYNIWCKIKIHWIITIVDYYGHARGDDERKEEVKLTNHNIMAVNSRACITWNPSYHGDYISLNKKWFSNIKKICNIEK